jgi:hypothetical protein
VLLPLLICLLVCLVHRAVDFDNKPCRCTVEVDNVAIYGMLPPEFQA